MASINDFVKNVTPGEHAGLEKALCVGEYVRWATRPERRGEFVEEFLFWLIQLLSWVMMLFSIVVLCLSFSEQHWPARAFFLVLGFSLLVVTVTAGIVSLNRRADRGQILYVLTNHRAIVQTPCRWRGWKQRSYPLHEHMLRSRICRPRGGGDLLFSVSQEGYGGGEQGFTHLPDLQLAHRELNAAINALLDAAEQHLGNRPPSC